MTEFNKLLSNKYFWSLVLAFVFGYCLMELIIMEYSKSSPSNLNNSVRHYNNLKPTTKKAISKNIKEENTLEQDMVNKMIATSKLNHPQVTPRYHPLLPNSAGSSLVD